MQLKPETKNIPILNLNKHNMKKLIIFSLFIFLFQPFLALSQNCTTKNVHLGECQEPFDLDYEDTGKSMSFPIMKGKTQKLVMTLPGKKDYYFTVCSETRDKLNFKIKSANNPNEVIFDNSKEFDTPRSIEFSMSFTNKILFEITLPQVYGGSNDNKPVCIGMLIFYKGN